MGKLSKFDDVDVFASLSAILKQNTGFYQSDFDIDKSIITQAAASPQKEDKTLLWLCRPMGTHCFRERDVFLKDTAPHNTWRFYREQTSDRILAYAIELIGTEHGKVKGNLYELDYARHYERVKDKELAADTVRLIYEHGTRDIPAGQYFAGNPDTLYGKFERFEAIPNDPDALRFLLQEEKHSREQLAPGDFKAHIAAGYEKWAKLHNLKQAARTLNFLTEHEIDSYPDLESRLSEITAASTEAAAALKAAERRLAEMAVLIKDVTTCKELRPLVQEYQQAADKKQFRRKHEGTLILYEAAAKALKEQGFQKLPDLYALKVEYKLLVEQKDQLQRQYNDAKRQMQEYGIIKQNVDGILRIAPGKEQMQER